MQSKKEYLFRGRKYCKSCKTSVKVKIGCEGKRWCRVCNELLSGKYALLLVLLLLLLVAGCKSSSTIASAPASVTTPTQSPQAQPSTVEQQVQQIKQVASSPQAQQLANATTQITNQASQTIFVPVQQPLPDSTVSINYIAPCILQNWAVLNIYCKAKTLWHNYSTVTSWYVSYPIVLFLLFLAGIWIWRLTKKLRGG